MKLAAVFAIKIYQKMISPLLGSNCRYYPTCSNYALDCFEKLPIHLAIWYSFLRIMKCNQFFSGGHDPVPVKKSK